FAGFADEIGRLTVFPNDGLCIPGATALCFQDRRFRAEMQFVANGHPGTGRAVTLTDQTGFFWFFNPENVEAVVKVLDGCAINGHFWVFAAGLTNVETTLTVTDLLTGARSTFNNPAGTAFQPIQNTAAF